MALQADPPLLEQLLTILVSAVIGASVGTLISVYLPKWLAKPRIQIVDLVPQGDLWQLVVTNNGSTAATHAMGRLTLRLINEGDVIGTTQEILEARKKEMDPDWKRNINSFLKAEQWGLGIEDEYLFWLTSMAEEFPYNTAINPGLPERLAVASSHGSWVDIASESNHRKRARLRLDKDKIYYGKIVVGASNCSLSKPYRFLIKLSDEGKAVLESYAGNLPDRVDVS